LFFLLDNVKRSVYLCGPKLKIPPMAKKIDKIIKENFEEIFIPLTKKLLKLEFEEAE
jgi:hypothetical protein